ncbi:MAG: hypothetical protein JW902_13490 [Syntrophaceae bacterium]|nr:hypothetical protein [Syntrophaceae bacterium]
MIRVNDKVKETILQFMFEFIEYPYLCYTEHGQHARFYQMLYEALDPSQRYLICMGQKVCAIQKEYPTAGNLGKPQRQHWDIAIIKSPAESTNEKKPPYDYLKLEAIIEFGMNVAEEHLEDDIRRVCHEDANAENKYIVHLYRLSKPGNQFSMRDWSSSSKQILTTDQVKARIPLGQSVSVFYGIYDDTDKSENGVWLIKDGAEPEKVVRM